MKKNLFSAVFVVLIFSLLTVTSFAKNVEYTYSAENASSEWITSGDTESFTFEEDSIVKENYTSFTAIYNNEIFESTEYEITLNNKASGTGNKLIVYFNYQDSSNYYCFTIGGAKESNPVKLIKNEAGTQEELGVYEHLSINYKATPFKVVCANGNIEVSSNGTVLFDVSDETFVSGKIGIGTQNGRGVFSGIKVSGKVSSYLNVTGTAPAEGEINVAKDTVISISFDKVLDPYTVTEQNVLVEADGIRLTEDMYDVMAEDSDILVVINEMEENAFYKIIVTTDVWSVDEEMLAEEFELGFETYKGDDYMEFVYDYNDIAAWEVSDSTYFTASETGIASNSYSAKFNAILSAYIFRDEFTYSMNVTSSGNSPSNAANIFFNYVDSDNYYCLTLGGNSDKTANPLTLSKYVGGVKTVLGSATASYNSAVEITYKNNKIVVNAGGEKKIETEDNEFTSGFIGVGITSTSGSFKNIKVTGFGKNVQLRLTDETNIENGDDNLPLDTNVELVFDSELKESTVTKSNISVLENSQPMSEDSYEIKLENKKVIITFKDLLKEKTDYTVEISGKVVSLEYGVGLSQSQRRISFKTKPPIYDVQSSEVKYFDSESNEYVQIDDIAQMGGKDVKLNISVKNNGNEPQGFAISAMIVQPDGEVIGAKYYAAELASGEEFNKDNNDTDNTLSVPQSIKSGAKIVYFVWNSFADMITLYPSGEF